MRFDREVDLEPKLPEHLLALAAHEENDRSDDDHDDNADDDREWSRAACAATVGGGEVADGCGYRHEVPVDEGFGSRTSGSDSVLNTERPSASYPDAGRARDASLRIAPGVAPDVGRAEWA